MLLIISTLSFLYTTLQIISYTFIDISFSHSLNFFVLITRPLFKSWHKSVSLLILLLSFPAPGKADDQSTTRISITISAWYPTDSKHIKMTIWNPMMSLVGNHPGKQRASGHEHSASHQHFKNELWPLNQLQSRCNPYIPSISRSILCQRRWTNVSLRRWHPRRYSIKRLYNWIHPLMSIFTRARTEINVVSNWLHGKLKICGNMSTVVTMWQASSSEQNTMPWQLFQAFWQWSWHMWSL